MTRRSGISILPYFLCAAALPVVYLLYRIYSMTPLYSDGAVELFAFFLLMALLVTGSILYYFNRLTPRTVAFLLLAAGIILRVAYMLYTPYDTRQHDVTDPNGHADYIIHLADTFSLPTTNAGEFYHPPFMYALGAAVYRIAALFGSNGYGCLNAVRLIPCFASCAVLILSFRILRSFGLKGLPLFLPTAIVAFHPAFLYLSASINNDMLALFFVVLALRYALRWHKSGGMKDILLLGLSIGLGMMTKLSAGLVALPVAALFLYHFVLCVRRRRCGRLLGQLCAFGALCVPLGLWYPVRNWLLFHQPLSYVLRFSNNLPIYCGDHSVLQRFFSFPLYSQLIRRVFGDSRVDYNIYIFTLKSALFGEWNFPGRAWMALILSLVNLGIVLLSLACMLWLAACLRKNKRARAGICLMGLTWLTQVISFVLFNVQYPFGCSMDFRYITVTVLTGAVFLGLALDLLRRRHPKLAKPAAVLLCTLTVLFCGFSALFYASI